MKVLKSLFTLDSSLILANNDSSLQKSGEEQATRDPFSF